MELPLVSNREAYCVGYGYNRLQENGTIIIIARTMDQATFFKFSPKSLILLNRISNFKKSTIFLFLLKLN